MIKLTALKPNPVNPRILKEDAFKKLVNSIEAFPKMMALRPIITDAEGNILAGNMRFKALKFLKYKEIPDDWVKLADDLTPEETKRFIVQDNASAGQWDWELLANEWDVEELQEWGLDVPVYDKSDSEIETKNIQPFKKTHILLSFPPAKMVEIQDLLNKIIEKGEIEYEQASN
jgi:ParB-like chromosome segregation protein Spo0J